MWIHILGPALANIFAGFHEKSQQSGPEKPEVYFRYIYGAFCLFMNEMESDLFFTFLNHVHPALKFTLKKKTNLSLPFIDILICRTTSFILSSV